jgi:parallel beta-helix repeat protein
LNYRIDEKFEGISTQYINHNPIMIDGNDEFIRQASAEGWIGEGTIYAPYIIEKLTISGSSSRNLIEIRNTNVYFQIQHCFLSGGDIGISLTNVRFGNISNNTIKDNQAGIIFWDSSKYNIIINNYVHSNNGEGIGLHSSDNNTITGNTVYKNNAGILLWESTEFNIVINNSAYSNNIEGIGLHGALKNTITGNIVYDNFGGFIIWEYSGYNVINNNTIYNNAEGIFVCEFANKNRLIYNTISFNSLGIGINSDNNYILYNSIYYNIGLGLDIDLESSNNNVVEWNNFINNNLGAFNPYQAYDVGSNNIFEYNYWDDLTIPDINDDGVVDIPYTIFGIANNQDPSPLTSLSPQTIFHALYLPTIIHPNGGETLRNSIVMQWVSSNDSLNHPVTYSVYYSSDNGKSWTLLVTGLTTTDYNWNTSTLVDGSSYLIKVVVTCSEGLIMVKTSDRTFSIQNGFSLMDLTPLIIVAILIILVIVIFIVGFVSLQKIPSKIEEPGSGVQRVSLPIRPDVPRSKPAAKRRPTRAKSAVLKSPLTIKSSLPTERLEEEPPVPIKPVDEDKKSLFFSIQYQVQDLIFEQDDIGLFVQIIPYSGSIRVIKVKIVQNQIIMSGCLKRENIPITSLELKIEGEPKEPSWDDPWQDISILGEAKIIKGIKARSEIANRLKSLGTAVIKFESQTKGEICFQLTCNEAKESVKLAYLLIKDLQLFFEISLY